MSTTAVSRRNFLAGAASAVGVAAVGALTGCSSNESATAKDAADETMTATGADATGGDVPAWLGTAPEIADDQCVETVDVDVLVVGAGNAGYFAAATAAEEGLATLLIESMPQGMGIRNSALGAVDSVMQKAQGTVINKMDIVNDIVRYADGQCDMRLWKMWADESGEAISWYIDHVNRVDGAYVELEWSMPEGTRYAMWPTGHGTTTAERGDMEKYFDEYIRSFAGCDVRFSCPLARLITENDAVVGAYAEGPEGTIRINTAKGVILATGGYAPNEDMMRALQHEIVEVSSDVLAMADNTGMGIKAALWAGAAFEPTHSSLLFDRGTITPDVEVGNPFETNGLYFSFSSQPWLKVNVDGERFINESTPYDYVIHAAASSSRNHAWYPVWDDNYVDDVQRFYTIGCSTQYQREGGDQHCPPLEGVRDFVEGYMNDGVVFKADTLEELANILGIDKQGFLATVERYNELYDAQEDSDFGKEAFRLSALRTPPYYGMKMGGLVLCTFDGIEVNADLQALREDDSAIEGLYMVGNDAGNVYHKTYPNFSAGLNAGRGATQARHAALTLARK